MVYTLGAIFRNSPSFSNFPISLDRSLDPIIISCSLFMVVFSS
jgi:hypothetical protein